jgi:uncharacterized protein YceK
MKALLAASLLVLGGCGTLHDLSGGTSYAPGPSVFGGVRRDAFLIHPGPTCGSGLFTAIGILDMPFSAALDVVLLPVTAPISLLRPPEPEAP